MLGHCCTGSKVVKQAAPALCVSPSDLAGEVTWDPAVQDGLACGLQVLDKSLAPVVLVRARRQSAGHSEKVPRPVL